MITKIDALAKHLEQQVRGFCDTAVVGISGGVDSAVVASICCAALGPKSTYLVSMPYGELDEKTFNLRSAELADQLGAHHLVIPIGKATDTIVGGFQNSFETLIDHKVELHLLTTGNTRSRIRMTTLYALAGELTYRSQVEKIPHNQVSGLRGQIFTKRVRVMGTGNASEDLIGYDTKGGDALADLFVIGDLFKSEVYQLARFYGVPQSIIFAPPSAGLYEGQTDQAELGWSYEELEPAASALHFALRRGVKDEELNSKLEEFTQVDKRAAEFVIARFKANAHKHRAPVVIQVRHTELVKDIFRKPKE